MEFNLLFIWGLGVSIFFLALLVIKTMLHTHTLKKTAKQTCSILERQVAMKTKILYKNSQNTILMDGLHQSLFNRFFKITQDLLLVQKFIFETYCN